MPDNSIRLTGTATITDQRTRQPTNTWRWRTHVAIFVVCAIACIAIALIEGKDFNWDLRNYHVYGPWALLTHRYGIDWMGGGPQGYLNPIAHIPLWLMIQAGLDDRVIASLLAVMHAGCLYFICLIANRLFSHHASRVRHMLIAASAVIALLSPIFLGLTGSTFTDPMVTCLMLASMHFALAETQPARGRTTWSGLLYGAAVGLKLTNLVFAPAIFAAMLLGALRSPITRAARWVAAFGAGLIMACGASAWALYRAYGSPTFPWFNSVFRSTLAASVGNSHDRFVPHSLWDAALWPLRLLDAHSWVYIENSAPDVRFLVLTILLLATGVQVIHRRCISATRSTTNLPISPAQRVAAVAQFWIFFGIAWICWLLVSGNGRYGLVLFLLLGPAIVLLACSLWSGSALALVVTVVIGIQGYLVLTSYPHRWTPTDWSGSFTEVATDAVDREPNGYVLVDTNSNSLAFPSLNPDSAYFAIDGQMANMWLPAVADRFDAFKNRWEGRMRLLYAVTDTVPATTPNATSKLLALHGLRLVETSTDHCSRVLIRANRSDPSLASRANLLSCPLATTTLDIGLQREQRRMHAIFNRVAERCRVWFPAGEDNPPMPRTAGWQRRYNGTDVVLFSWDERLFLSRGDFGPFDVFLGTTTQWTSPNTPSVDCRPLPRHYDAGENPIRNLPPAGTNRG